MLYHLMGKMIGHEATPLYQGEKKLNDTRAVELKQKNIKTKLNVKYKRQVKKRSSCLL